MNRGDLFLNFFWKLRECGLPVAPDTWMVFLDALGRGLHGSSLDGFYQVARCILARSESDYDAFDLAFSSSFEGVEADLRRLTADLEGWLRDPAQLAGIDPELARLLQTLGIDELRRRLFERLAEQKERHTGGNKWIGSGGTSPFGTGGMHPSGVRIGGGGGRSALAVADARTFREYRRDVVLDTRRMATALRKLRHMARRGHELELDLEATVDRTAQNCGDLEIVERPPRHNDIHVLLLLDVGGSMDPHSELVSRLFAAASLGGGIRRLDTYHFHNCPYAQVYEDARFTRRVALTQIMATLDPETRLVLVGDAWMHPGELSLSGGDMWNYGQGPSGLTWLGRLADRFPHCAWLNPEPPGVWSAPSVAAIASIFPMFPLTLDGIDAMVQSLKSVSGHTQRGEAAALLRGTLGG